MKKFRNLMLTVLCAVLLTVGCEDEDLNPYIPPQGNAHGFGQFVSLADNTTLLPALNAFYSQSAVNAVVYFTAGSPNGIDYKLQWVSIDNRVTISDIELYIEFNETYSDDERNPLIAAHGGASQGPTYPAGKFWKTVQAPAMRTPVDITITPSDVYELFRENTFDYNGDGQATEPVFGTPGAGEFRRDRTGQRFFAATSIPVGGAGNITLPEDQFRIRWRLIGSDGAAYGSWSNSVCAETVGANCTGQWRVRN